MTDNRRQYGVLSLLVAINAAVAFIVFAFGFNDQIPSAPELPEPLASMPGWVLGLANAGIIVVVYGLLGVAGLWFARRLELPGIIRAGAGPRRWFAIPLALGAVLGVVLVIGDRLFAAAGPAGWTGFPHPEFPMALFASAAAGIGEEIVFRLFVLGLWGFLLSLVLRRWNRMRLALWIANIIAALAFGAGHLPAAMMMLGVASPAEMPTFLLVEIFVLNGIVGLVAGERHMKDGLVAAVGVHFWTDIVWHVLWPVVGGGT